MTDEDIEAEFWSHFFDSKNAGEEFSDDDFKTDDIVAQMEAEGEAELAAQAAAAALRPPAAEVPHVDPAEVDDWEEVPDA